MRGSERGFVVVGRGPVQILMAAALVAASLGLEASPGEAAPAPAEPTFVGLSKTVGVGGFAVATGDVDGDGDLDLAATNQHPGSVSMLVGNGDGTFADHVDYATGANPDSVAFGDLNGDGPSDVIVADDSGVSVLVANGDGTLASHTEYAPGGPFFTRGLAIGDVNGDDLLDVVVGTGGVGSGASLLLGNGDGTLAAATSVYVVAGGTTSVALADVNGDTVLDLLTTEASQDRVEVLLGDGAGGFAPHASLSTGSGTLDQVVSADLDVDGDFDVIAVDSITDLGSVFLGNGDGSFGAVKQFSAGSRAHSVAAGDLNGDGFPDLAVADAFAFTRVLLGRGDGTFASSSTSISGENISVVLGQFNGDTFMDFATAGRSSTQTSPDTVTVLLNTTGLAMDRPQANCAEARATVSWTAPVGASAVTGYVVTPYIGYTAEPSITFNSTATTQTITGLNDGTEYRFKVAARNAVGAGSFSKVTNPVTPAPAPSVPDSPKVPKATAGNAQATVSWNSASNGCSPITGYVITPYVGYFPLPSSTFNSSETTQVVTGLKNGTMYRFRIRAVNAIGTGGYSKVTNPATPTAT